MEKKLQGLKGIQIKQKRPFKSVEGPGTDPWMMPSRNPAASLSKASKIKSHTKGIKMSKIPMRTLKRIKSKCLECSGDSPKEVTLCHLFECPLWQSRFGYSMKTKRYKRRMEKAKKQFSKEFQELIDMGINIRNFFV